MSGEVAACFCIQINNLCRFLSGDSSPVASRRGEEAAGILRLLQAATFRIAFPPYPAPGVPMRMMNIRPPASLPSSLEECVKIYLQRLRTGEAPPYPHISFLLTAYMAWPNDEPRRDGWMATNIGRLIQDSGVMGAAYNQTPSGEAASQAGTAHEHRTWEAFQRFGGLAVALQPAFDQLTEEITDTSTRWPRVADIFQIIVDMNYDDRITLRGGPSISKAIDICELHQKTPGRSQLAAAWSQFHDVAHLITAGAYLAHHGIAQDGGQGGSIFDVAFVAPDALLAMAAGMQEFGLNLKPFRQQAPILKPDTLWRIPSEFLPERPFIHFRRLTDAQIVFLNERRVPRKGAKSSDAP